MFPVLGTTSVGRTAWRCTRRWPLARCHVTRSGRWGASAGGCGTTTFTTVRRTLSWLWSYFPPQLLLYRFWRCFLPAWKEKRCRIIRSFHQTVQRVCRWPGHRKWPLIGSQTVATVYGVTVHHAIFHRCDSPISSSHSISLIKFRYCCCLLVNWYLPCILQMQLSYSWRIFQQLCQPRIVVNFFLYY